MPPAASSFSITLSSPYTDHLGSIMALTDGQGTVVHRQAFDAWGRRRPPQTWQTDDTQVPAAGFEWLRGYTGHEHLDSFGLINRNARLYDPKMGRMLSVDNYVSAPGTALGYNRYAYALNNPISYVDRDGNFAFVPFLVAMAYGALIGAGTSAAVYTVTAGSSWNWNSFGKAVGMGALGGALGGGIGYVGTGLGAFGHSLGFNVLNNVASNTATNLAFGGKVTTGSLIGSALGGVVGAGIGNFAGVKGNGLLNAGAELAFGAVKGAVTGGVSGGVGAAIDGGDIEQGLLNGAKYGAVGGVATAGLNISLYGPAYIPDRKYGDFGRNGPVYRRGTFITKAGNALLGQEGAVTLGRNIVMNTLKGRASYEAHETGHFYQQIQMGFGNFYGRTAYEYIIYPGFQRVYITPGTLEDGADKYFNNLR